MADTQKAFQKVLTDLSKAVISVLCEFHFLTRKDEDLGFTYREASYMQGSPSQIIAKVFVNPDHSYFARLDEEHKRAATFGVSVHELLHQKFTDFEGFEQVVRRTTLDRKANLLKTVFNIFEDSRIEYFANQVFGGNALAGLRYCIKLIWEKSPEIDSTAPELDQVLNALIQYGDMGKIKGSFGTQHAKRVFLRVVELFDKAVTSPDCQNCIQLSLAATDILNHEFPSGNVPLAPKMSQGGRGERARSQKSSQTSASARQKQKERRKTRNEIAAQDNASQDSVSNDEEASKGSTSESDGACSTGNNSSGGSANDGFENSTDSGAETPFVDNCTNPGSDTVYVGTDEGVGTDEDDIDENEDEADEDIDQLEEAFTEALDALVDDLSDKITLAEHQIEESAKLSYGSSERFEIQDEEASHGFLHIMPVLQDVVDMYLARLPEIQGYADELVSSLDVIMRTKREGWDMSKTGRLNIKRFYDPNFQSPYVFDKRLGKTNDVAVALLIDESGSMCAFSRIEEAKKMAMVMSEAFNELGISFAVFGHSAEEQSSNDLNIRVYKNFDDDQWFSLELLKARSINFDGAAIATAGGFLSKREEANKLLIVLTDGSSHNVPNAELAIREVSQFATVCGVALATNEADSIRQMYGENFIVVKKMSELNDKLTEKLIELSVNW